MRRAPMILLTVVLLAAATISVQAAGSEGHRIMMMHGMHGMAMKTPGGDGLPGMRMDMAEHIATVLHLADDQKATFKQLHEDLQAKVEPLFEQSGKLSDQLEQALAASNPDPKTVGALVIQQHQIHQQIKAAHDDLMTKMSAQLTADQKVRLEVLQDMHEGGPEGGLPRFSPSPGF
jgi:Spy/CpxP family protein refolding chaperone